MERNYPMKTDIQIAQEATMLPVIDVAKQIGIEADDLAQSWQPSYVGQTLFAHQQ